MADRYKRGGLRRQQRPRNGGMAIAQRLQLDLVALVLLFGQRDQPQQRIGDAAARGQDDAQALLRLRLQNVGHALEAGSVRDARTAEFVHHPAVGRLVVRGRGNGGGSGGTVVLELI